MELTKVVSGYWIRLLVAITLVALWLACTVAVGRWVREGDADEQVRLHVVKLAREIADLAESAGGDILVSDFKDTEASLLLSVTPTTAEEIGSFLNEQSTRIGSEVSVWDNGEMALVNVMLSLSKSQMKAMRTETNLSVSGMGHFS